MSTKCVQYRHHPMNAAISSTCVEIEYRHPGILGRDAAPDADEQTSPAPTNNCSPTSGCAS